MADNHRTAIVKDALSRFRELPTRTIARYILQENGLLFDNDLEKVRSAIRYLTGKHGLSYSDKASRPGYGSIKHGPVKMPKTWREVRHAYSLDPGLWGIMGDLHIPFHEPRPIESTIKYFQANKITGLLLNGDAHDCCVS